jgi:predicted nucleic acid-binding protein
MIYIIDSSIYIDWLRRKYEFIEDVYNTSNNIPIYICGIIVIEVLRGVLNPKTKAILIEFFNTLPGIQMDREFWIKTANLAWELDRKGKMLPLADLIIGTSALTLNAILITTDKHFKKIPGLKIKNKL